MKFRVVGAGRAGTSLARALERAGWTSAGLLGRADDVSDAARGVDVLIIATPDRAIAEVARAVEPSPNTVVAHLSGAQGLDVLDPHPRRAALHPLMTMPDAERGAARLAGAWFAVAGDPLIERAVVALGGRSFTVADGDRAAYHAAAVVASNHIVVLLGQVERIAHQAHVPFAAFFDLVRASVDNAEALGPRAALTGPAARGDLDTIARHLAALAATERDLYRACADAAAQLASGGVAPQPER